MPKIVKTKRENRFSNPRLEKNIYNSFSFEKAMKSYDNDELMFTNFVKSKGNTCYCLLEEYYIDSLDDKYYFLEEDFKPLDDINYTYKKADRLLNIINKGYKHKYKVEDLKYIFKMQHKDKKGFQLYVFKSKNNLNVILIDFFHIALPADRILPNGSVIKENVQREYNKEKDNKWGIENIL